MAPILIARTLLVASGSIDGLTSARAAAAVARGLERGGWDDLDLCPVDGGVPVPLDLDARLHRSRAVVLAFAGLHEDTLPASPAFEIATRARQGGVPAYALLHASAIGAFAARMLDLQVVVEATSARGLAAAAQRLAKLVS